MVQSPNPCHFLSADSDNTLVIVEDATETTPRSAEPDTSAEGEILIDEDVVGY